MRRIDVETILKEVEALLARAGELPAEAASAVAKLLNVVEALCADRKELASSTAVVGRVWTDSPIGWFCRFEPLIALDREIALRDLHRDLTNWAEPLMSDIKAPTDWSCN